MVWSISLDWPDSARAIESSALKVCSRRSDSRWSCPRRRDIRLAVGTQGGLTRARNRFTASSVMGHIAADFLHTRHQPSICRDFIKGTGQLVIHRQSPKPACGLKDSAHDGAAGIGDGIHPARKLRLVRTRHRGPEQGNTRPNKGTLMMSPNCRSWTSRPTINSNHP